MQNHIHQLNNTATDNHSKLLPVSSISAKGKTFNDVQGISYNEAGRLLGTSPITFNGEHNYYRNNQLPP